MTKTPNWLVIYLVLTVCFGVFLTAAIFPSARTVFGESVADAVGGQYAVALLWARTVAFTLLFITALIWRNLTYIIVLLALRVLIDVIDFVAAFVLGFQLDSAGEPLMVAYGTFALFADIAPGAWNVILYLALSSVLIAPPATVLTLLLRRRRRAV